MRCRQRRLARSDRPPCAHGGGRPRPGARFQTPCRCAGGLRCQKGPRLPWCWSRRARRRTRTCWFPPSRCHSSRTRPPDPAPACCRAASPATRTSISPRASSLWPPHRPRNPRPGTRLACTCARQAYSSSTVPVQTPLPSRPTHQRAPPPCCTQPAARPALPGRPVGQQTQGWAHSRG